MELPVVVLNWNGWEDSFDCLRSLRNVADVSAVWLVDNGSLEDRSGEATAILPGVRRIRHAQNYGYAGGYNRALRLASREGCRFAYLLNNDAVVTPGFLATVVEAAVSNPEFAAVGSVVLFAGTDLIQFDGTYHEKGARRWEPKGSTGPRSQLTLAAPGHPCGAGMLVRLDLMEKFGYFDERFFCYGEEAEWCRRLQRHGFASAVCLDSVILHKGARSDTDHNAIYYSMRNRFLPLESEEVSSRRRAQRQIIYDTAVRAEMARRDLDVGSWLALADALDDGLRGRFGERRIRKQPLRAWIRLGVWSAFAHVHDRWQRVRGRPPGYGDSFDYWQRGC